MFVIIIVVIIIRITINLTIMIITTIIVIIIRSAGRARRRRRGPGPGSLGWHYVSNATCLMRPHLYYVCFCLFVCYVITCSVYVFYNIPHLCLCYVISYVIPYHRLACSSRPFQIPLNHINSLIQKREPWPAAKARSRRALCSQPARGRPYYYHYYYYYYYYHY